MAGWLNKYEQGGLVLKKKTKDNYGKKANPNDVQASVGPDFVGLGYNTKGRNYSPAWGGQFQVGGVLGKRFLQPNDSKLPKGWNPKEKGYSTEYSTTVGKDGEYYLVPGFKQGKLVSDPEREFNKTGELLGGPFKTIQSAQDFADRRHKYVEQGKPVPSPLKTYDEFAMGGSMPGAVGFMYARTQDPAPANGKYTKKTKASAQNGKKVKEDSNLENIAEIFDPTGISSWDDIYRSYKETGMSPQTALDIFGAIPMLGKFGKVGKYVGELSKAFAVTGRQKRNAKASAETLKAIGKYGPGTGKVTDAYQAAEQWQNGGEMKFYQEGLDFKPKSISKNGSVIKDDRGQWAYPGEITEIGSNDITMQGVDYPVLGVSDTGDTQMMYPDQDYKFDGEKVTEYPMAQKGKTIQPTLQDSIALYNNSKQVQDYYNKTGKYKKDSKDFFHTNEESTLKFVHDQNNKDLEFFRRRGSARVPLTGGKGAKSIDLPESIYYRKLDDNKYLQREGASAILDTRAPMQLFDKRIAPTQGSGYGNYDKSDPLFGDALSINTYDPVLVKPVSMLTPEEMKLRLKRYGKDSGIKETVSKPTQKPVSKPKPKSTPKSEPAPVAAKQPAPEKPTPQPKPLYEYEGESVMAKTPGGGGGAMVGVRKKDGTVEYIRPEDYQRMGVPKYGQDYIKSKQKMEDGGWLNKYK